jgi:hypothetical protein
MDRQAEAGATGWPVIFELPKRGGTTLRAAITDYCGSRFLDVREWAELDGKPLATRKGVTVPLEAIRALGEALMAVSRTIPPSGTPTVSEA